MLDYTVWSLVAPYLDVRSLVTVRRVHRDGRHPFPCDAARMLVHLVVNKSGKLKRYAMVEATDGEEAVVDTIFFKGVSRGPLLWGHHETTMCRRLQTYLGMRTCHVDVHGHVRVARTPSLVVSALYAFLDMRCKLLITLRVEDAEYLLTASPYGVTVKSLL